MTEMPDAGSVVIAHNLTVLQQAEPAVVISRRHYDRLIERLDGCQHRGLADLWLAAAGAAIALAGGALVGLLTLPRTPEPGARTTLLTLITLSGMLAAACVFAYLSKRRDLEREVCDLKRDLQTYAGL